MEVVIQKKLKHPNIVQLYEYFEAKKHEKASGAHKLCGTVKDESNIYLLLEFARALVLSLGTSYGLLSARPQRALCSTRSAASAACPSQRRDPDDNDI